MQCVHVAPWKLRIKAQRAREDVNCKKFPMQLLFCNSIHSQVKVIIPFPIIELSTVIEILVKIVERTGENYRLEEVFRYCCMKNHSQKLMA